MPGRDANRKTVGKLLLVAAGMFAFGVFGMPPLYERFCEFTGIGQAGVRVGQASAAMAAGDRTVRIRFDATTNSALPWRFRPNTPSMEVQVGMPSEASYNVLNLRSSEIQGRAVYNVSPPEAALYFVKTECFCFKPQGLEPGQEKDMPVRFYIDPDLPAEIGEITLSYTFFLDQATPGVAGLSAKSDNVN